MTQPRANAIVNALMRLDRSGDENSAANAKLKAAAVQVAQHIAAKVGPDTALPRAYFTGRDGKLYGCRTPEAVTLAMFDPMDINAARQLAQDVATGFLDEVSAFLEARTQEAERAAETLKGAELP